MLLNIYPKNQTGKPDKYFDKTAFLEFSWDFYAIKKENGEQIHTLGCETQLLVLRNNEWKISTIHYS